jgi:hypothetical protein
MRPLPYRSAAKRRHEREEGSEPPGLPDAEVVGLLLVLSLFLLPVVVETALHGRPFGAGSTVCGAVIVIAIAHTFAAWRARRIQQQGEAPPRGRGFDDR